MALIVLWNRPNISVILMCPAASMMLCTDFLRINSQNQYINIYISTVMQQNEYVGNWMQSLQTYINLWQCIEKTWEDTIKEFIFYTAIEITLWLLLHHVDYIPWNMCTVLLCHVLSWINNHSQWIHLIYSQYSKLLPLTQMQLEWLERLHSENTPHRPMITHTIDSYQIPSQRNMERM